MFLCYRRVIVFFGLLLINFIAIYGQTKDNTALIIADTSQLFQVIDNFGASDAWSCQFIGNWPKEKKQAIADLLFSTKVDIQGNPLGIALNMWRYNLGAGSSNQNENSGIKDEWHRAPSFKSANAADIERMNGQNWFLKAASVHGVKQFIAFYNSPPVYLTTNRKAFASNGTTNIVKANYKAFAKYTAQALGKIKNSTGITFNYLSPVNEPQWQWSDGKQEGCPYNNEQISSLIKAFNTEFKKTKSPTKLLLPEAAHLRYAAEDTSGKQNDNQLFSFFNPASKININKLSYVAKIYAYHSYFTTSTFEQAKKIRESTFVHALRNNAPKLWQSEYCILGDNAGEINGEKKDTGITAAIYLAKVIYEDLVFANVSAWQWWLAVSPYDYKDGLIYVDKKKENGNFTDSKMLWAFGNYSRFITPGSQRFLVSTANENLLVSGYKTLNGSKIFVIINATNENIIPSFIINGSSTSTTFKKYTTSQHYKLQYSSETIGNLILPSKSIVTLIEE